ncbi:MAG: GNAT family N-acetyltransferase [Chloroflexia bacterium]|nr:GNAT family N-acetyltransferase [Chloroflexia bacterium]
MSDDSITIRRLTEVDAALAAQLNAEFDEGMVWDAAEGRRFLESGDNLLLAAFWGGQVRGFATAHRLQRFDRRRAEVLLYEIGVNEGFQRRGVGTALVAEVKRWAREVGADEVWVLTERDNTAAMALYTATGGHADPPGTTMFTYLIED